MNLRKGKLTYKGIFLAAWFIVLVSRILVLTDNYSWPIGPVLLEVLYLMLTVFLVLFAKRGVLVFQRGKHWYVLCVFVLHTLLWGLVFVDSRFDDLILSHFKSQIMFVVILLVTVWAVHCFDAEKAFLKCCCYALSCMLIYQLATHLSEVDLSNLANIMSASERTRANFGFGHYNALGAACVCNILLLDSISKRNGKPKPNVMMVVFLGISVIMLLCSASRSSITSLLLYYMVFAALRMNEWRISKRLITALQVVLLLVTSIVIVCILAMVDMDEFLIAAQRSHLVTHTLPMFFETGKIWLGLGYASNVAYAMRQTPYTTYWMDNGYIYLLVTTGWIGFGLLMSALWCLARAFIKQSRTPHGKRMLAVLAVYLYISLFETAMFSSGSIVNYVYIPWCCLCVAEKSTD